MIDRRAWLLAPAVVGALAAPTAAEAAATRSGPTGCVGRLAAAPTVDAPNGLQYRFFCNAPIGGYTIIVTRLAGDDATIDDFSPTADVLQPQAVYGPVEQIDTSTSFSCGGAIPGAGVNCNGEAKLGETVRGTIDTFDPYCGGTRAGVAKRSAPLPRAQVELVVSDDTGAQDGPLPLNLSSACPKPRPTPVVGAHPRHRAKGRPKAVTHRRTRRKLTRGRSRARSWPHRIYDNLDRQYVFTEERP